MLRRSCMSELTVAVCRNCLAERPPALMEHPGTLAHDPLTSRPLIIPMGAGKSLSDSDLSTAANGPRPSASYSARINPQFALANTPQGFPGLPVRVQATAGASHLAAPSSPRPERQCRTAFQEGASPLFFLELMIPMGSQGGSEAGFQFQAFGFASGGVGNLLSKENDLGTLGEREQSTAVFEQIPLRD